MEKESRPLGRCERGSKPPPPPPTQCFGSPVWLLIGGLAWAVPSGIAVRDIRGCGTVHMNGAPPLPDALSTEAAVQTSDMAGHRAAVVGSGPPPCDVVCAPQASANTCRCRSQALPQSQAQTQSSASPSTPPPRHPQASTCACAGAGPGIKARSPKRSTGIRSSGGAPTCVCEPQHTCLRAITTAVRHSPPPPRAPQPSSQPPLPRFGDPISLNQPETLARISGFLIVVAKKTIC